MEKILAHTTLPRMADNHLLFVLTAPMTAIFLMAASMKIGANWMMIMGFDGYGFPVAFLFFIGYAEFFGAISLWIRRWALLGAMGLSVILLGASLTHLINNDPIAPGGHGLRHDAGDVADRLLPLARGQAGGPASQYMMFRRIAGAADPGPPGRGRLDRTACNSGGTPRCRRRPGSAAAAAGISCVPR